MQDIGEAYELWQLKTLPLPLDCNWAVYLTSSQSIDSLELVILLRAS